MLTEVQGEIDGIDVFASKLSVLIVGALARPILAVFAHKIESVT
jgi:hypothetical protein